MTEIRRPVADVPAQRDQPPEPPIRSTDRARADSPAGTDGSRAQHRQEVAAVDAAISRDRSTLTADRGSGPRPELRAADQETIANRRLELARAHPEDFARLSRDPDHGRAADVRSQEEAKTALDMRASGRLPPDVRRPETANKGDLVGTVDGESRHWDIKQFRDSWPPGVPRREGQPFSKGMYKTAEFARSLQVQFDKGRDVILDTRTLRQETIDDMARTVDERGWGKHVKWYP